VGERKRWGKLDVQTRVNVAGLMLSLKNPPAKLVLGWHIRELRFQMAPTTPSENE